MSETPIPAEVIARARWDRYRKRMESDPEFPPLPPWEELSPDLKTLKIDDERAMLRVLADVIPTVTMLLAAKAHIPPVYVAVAKPIITAQAYILAAAAEGEKDAVS
jgi:hypothetical protein